MAERSRSASFTGRERSGDTGVLLEHLFRRQAGRMVAHLTRLLGPANLDLAEETVQEAMLRALQSWPYQGAPENAAHGFFAWRIMPRSIPSAAGASPRARKRRPLRRSRSRRARCRTV